MQEALAQLRWYLDMGVDEALEEQPQNRLALVQPVPEPVMPGLAEAPAPALKSPTAPSFAASASVAETQALAEAATTLDALRDAVYAFKGLSICRTATNPVFAEGNPKARLMIIGEAPGAEEDRQGVPFCGPSGQLLDKMLASIGYNRQENAYITNTIFWRPPGNRNPTVEEQSICRPLVDKHIALIDPEMIFLVGGMAVRSLLQKEESLGSLRGREFNYINPFNTKSYKIRISYHPSYLLRTPQQKRLAWQDLLQLKTALRS